MTTIRSVEELHASITLQELDFDPELPCTARTGVECPNTAVWEVTKPCHCKIYTCCDVCWQAHLRYMERIAPETDGFCHLCHLEYDMRGIKAVPLRRKP